MGWRARFRVIGQQKRWAVLAVVLVFVWGCEAEFDLSDIRARGQAAIRDTDNFQAAAANGDTVVLAGNGGLLLVSADRGQTWLRTKLPGDAPLTYPDFIDVAACPDGSFAALDATRGVWFSARNVERWARGPTPLKEEGFDLTCDSGGRVWVVGAFMLIASSSDQGRTWDDQSLGDDAIFTAVQFTGPDDGVIVGEFGMHYRSSDGGKSWDIQPPIPNEFYPLAALFQGRDRGWLAGLQGAILFTSDRGASWTKQETGIREPIYGLASEGDDLRAVGGRESTFELSGSRWVPLNSDKQGQGYLRAVVSVGGGKFLAAGQDGRVVLLNGKAG